MCLLRCGSSKNYRLCWQLLMILNIQYIFGYFTFHQTSNYDNNCFMLHIIFSFERHFLYTKACYNNGGYEFTKRSYRWSSMKAPTSVTSKIKWFCIPHKRKTMEYVLRYINATFLQTSNGLIILLLLCYNTLCVRICKCSYM